MAATSEYPVNGDPLTRGEPWVIPVDIAVRGVPRDVTAWTWRAHVRRTPDAPLLAAFTFETTTPPDSDIPCRLLMHLTAEDTALITTGCTFDLEQLEPEHRTWWLCRRLRVTDDDSHTP